MPDPETPKKRLPGLAIAGIGCLSLLLLGLVLGGFLFMKACSKFKEVAGDFQNPAKAAAILAIKANPDLEWVKTDDATGEITVRNKKTGETTTWSFEDIKNGKLTVKNSKTGETFVAGNLGAAGAPAWVPAYPGLKELTGSGMRSEKPTAITGLFSAETSDPVGKVKEFYYAQLEAAGYKTEINTINLNGIDHATVAGTLESPSRKVTVIITTKEGNSKTQVTVEYDGAKR